jgi:hypothetical protein
MPHTPSENYPHPPTTAQDHICRAQACLTDSAAFDFALSALLDHVLRLADQQRTTWTTLATVKALPEELLP